MVIPRILDPNHVKAALHADQLVPPAAPPSIGNGAIADLRSSMARFSSGDDHSPRRASVDLAVDAIARADVATVAETQTNRLLSSPIIEVLTSVGFTVPTRTLGTALGVAPDALTELTADVRAIVEVIGRGADATPAADSAVPRLRSLFADRPGGADATISLLYQNHDATAALLASRLLAPDDSKRRGALPKTVRFVTADVDLSGLRLETGSMIELSLDDPALEFGAGVHRCPGSELAGAIVDGMLEALGGWTVVEGDVEYDAEGRAHRVPMMPPE